MAKTAQALPAPVCAKSPANVKKVKKTGETKAEVEEWYEDEYDLRCEMFSRRNGKKSKKIRPLVVTGEVEFEHEPNESDAGAAEPATDEPTDAAGPSDATAGPSSELGL